MFYLFTGYELIPIPPDTKIYVQAYYFERSNDHAYTVIDVSHLVESYPADSADCCPQT
jgi:hypothetical protein